MKKTIVLLLATGAGAVLASAALAMPSQDEMSKVQPLVAKLMEPSVAAFKAKKISGSEVGDRALMLADEAEGDAAKFLCMKNAVTYYVKDKEYDKAAETIEAIMAQFPDMPPETLHAITSSATRNAMAKSSESLIELHKMAGKKAASAKKLKAIKKHLDEKPADKGLIRQYAELNAANGNWDEALKSFAKLGGDIGKMAKNELDGNASTAQLAEFWWGYKAQESGAKDGIRKRAAMLYQSAIDSGELKGLNKTLAETCIAEAESSSSSGAPTIQKNLLHRWSFSGNLKDSVGKSNGKTIGSNVTFEKGQVRLRPEGGYVDLGANVIPGGGETEYTIEIWATKYSVQWWARVFHVIDNWGDNDFHWAWNHDTNPLKWGLKTSGTGQSSYEYKDGTGLGVENQFVVVYRHDKAKRPCYDFYIMRGDKVYWKHHIGGFNGSMFKDHSAFWLGHGSRGERTPDASYNEVRIWDRAFTEEEVMRSAKYGPDRLP